MPQEIIKLIHYLKDKLTLCIDLFIIQDLILVP